ncbi:MAG: hypothetical protein JW821_13325 [Deltaproteobacteria bacterium]|nr:hypothetical protein [Deltaproteobacteria bacterium]
MFFSKESRKAVSAVQELRGELEGMKQVLSDLQENMAGYVAETGAGHRELRSLIQQGFDHGAEQCIPPNSCITKDQYEKAADTLSRDLLSLHASLDEIDKRLASTREDILNLQRWTSTVEREMKAIREQIEQAVTEIKNKISYVVFRLQK